MKKVMLFVYRLIVVVTLLSILAVVGAQLGVSALSLDYQAAKDTRTTAHKIFHPFTSDMEYVAQPGGGADRLYNIANGLR